MNNLVVILYGLITFIIIAGIARLSRLDVQQWFYPAVLIIIALFYVYFAINTQDKNVLIREGLYSLIFITVALFSIKSRYFLYIVAAGLILHGVFDAIHHYLVDNQGVPSWWAVYCAVVDTTLGVWLIVLYRYKNNKTVNPE